MSKLNRLFRNHKFSHKDSIIVATQPESVYAESFRKIPINIKYSRVDDEPRVIQITSSLSGEHKSTSAANIAAVYRELGHKVILVDCDLRKPSIHRITGLVNTDGLTDYLVGNTDYANLIKQTRFEIDVINAGNPVPFPHVALRSEKFKNLIAKLRESYEYVIVDSPPLLLVTDSLIIGEICDTAVFVINQRTTKKNAAKEAIRLLRESNIPIAGIVLSNTAKRIRRISKYYSYKYKYTSKK